MRRRHSITLVGGAVVRAQLVLDSVSTFVKLGYAKRRPCSPVGLRSKELSK